MNRESANKEEEKKDQGGQKKETENAEKEQIECIEKQEQRVKRKKAIETKEGCRD